MRYKGTQVLPDRFEHDPPYRYATLCTVCLDTFLVYYPTLFTDLRQREVTGLQKKRKQKNV